MKEVMTANGADIIMSQGMSRQRDRSWKRQGGYIAVSPEGRAQSPVQVRPSALGLEIFSFRVRLRRWASVPGKQEACEFIHGYFTEVDKKVGTCIIGVGP